MVEFLKPIDLFWVWFRLRVWHISRLVAERQILPGATTRVIRSGIRLLRQSVNTTPVFVARAFLSSEFRAADSFVFRATLWTLGHRALGGTRFFLAPPRRSEH